jgi:hypothetical protein
MRCVKSKKRIQAGARRNRKRAGFAAQYAKRRGHAVAKRKSGKDWLNQSGFPTFQLGTERFFEYAVEGEKRKEMFAPFVAPLPCVLYHLVRFVQSVSG